jgi:hypothetical protein
MCEVLVVQADTLIVLTLVPLTAGFAAIHVEVYSLML